MLARLLHLHPKSHGRLVRLSREAERDGAHLVAKRLQAIVLNSEGRTSGELAGILKAPRLTAEQRAHLGDILDSGPVAYGLDTDLWTSPLCWPG